ncbi:DUF3515 family protein [Couchioplanes azureus]|uniref:DUF3515 family protein n=1 Tax=Couchioplanes caeruleus TaxID=56438 RepID=UPI00167091E9|nr:DUF3515 family protein [Couchioplanes caeruleus]GGQ37962.1 hypothetical protein GCM10010166_00380 [Couchioplanes caeruleus subsp. azureus]
MVDVETRTEPQPPTRDPVTRSAALWATVVAVPVAILAGLLIFSQLTPGDAGDGAAPAPSATRPAAVPGTPVQMAAPALAGRAKQVCLAVTSQLPAQVRDLAPRKVSAGPEQNAAYGEPPITVACGVPQPRMCKSLTESGSGCVPMDTELMNMNRVCWYADQQPAATTFTTMDREVPVRVTVPKQYAQAAQWANEFSDAVVQTDKSITQGVPSGCV